MEWNGDATVHHFNGTPPTSFSDDTMAGTWTVSDPMAVAYTQGLMMKSATNDVTSGMGSLLIPADHDGSLTLAGNVKFKENVNKPGRYPSNGSADLLSDVCDEDELTPFEYARYHGLTTSYMDEDPRCTVPLPSTPKSADADLADPQATLNLDTLVALGALNGHNCHERWEVDKNAAKFLASAIALGKEYETQDEYGLDEAWSLRDLKTEEPLMSSDPGLELVRLKRRNALIISTEGIPPICLDAWETPSWTVEELHLPAEKDRNVAHEKLDVDNETMQYLKEIFNIPPEGDDEMIIADCGDTLLCPLMPLTPPLMPLSPSLSLAGLSASAGELEFTSTPEDLIATEAREMEEQIINRDTLLEPDDIQDLKPETFDYVEIYGLSPATVQSSSLPARRKRLEDLKADVPILPQDATEPPAKKLKTVSFPEELHTLIAPADSDSSNLDARVAEQDTNTFLNDVLAPLAERAIRRSDNEQLIEFDTTVREPVPAIEAVTLLPPWQELRNDGRSVNPQAMVSRVKKEFMQNEARWSGVSKVETHLPWSPFPARLGKVEEEVFDDGSLARYMAELTFDEDLDIDSLISYTLPALDLTEDDEVLEVAAFEEEGVLLPPSVAATSPRLSPESRVEASGRWVTEQHREHSTGRLDMTTLLKKRKLKLEAAGQSMSHTVKAAVPGASRDSANLASGRGAAQNPTRLNDLVNGGGLSGFMHLYGAPTVHSPVESNQELAEVRVAAPETIVAREVDESAREVNELCTTLVVPTPELGATAADFTSVVVSSQLLSNRELIRRIQSALPHVDLIEREEVSNAPTKTGKAGYSIRDADITVSPGSGIILTTLQKLKQKALPGQTTFFGVHEQIFTTSSRYEHLVVLASEARQPSCAGASATGALDERDTEALAGLMGFVATLDTDVEVRYVAGGDIELANWVAACISRWTINSDLKLLQDETLWERFLRRAGMNPMAAQAVLAKLKVPESVFGSDVMSITAESSSARHGLVAFVDMAPDERVERLSQTVQGSNVMSRVNGVVESRWLATSNTKAT
ncbi:structural constituent of nuclear pore [Vermiconidia calcicola]|uniref:Structural constituent of nuclear pore n=1 Tax=Vermiconidia calcicola TaxID=1690605 RepID=A0ACC3NEB5_9PEZI|nr:structural constituent of nuclear pore [Vermiconidia calcicola]